MTIKEQHKPWQVRLQGTDEAHSAEQNGHVNVRGVFLRFLPQTKRIGYLPCAGYLARSFQNQEVNSHVGNLSTTYLMRR